MKLTVEAIGYWTMLSSRAMFSDLYLKCCPNPDLYLCLASQVVWIPSDNTYDKTEEILTAALFLVTYLHMCIDDARRHVAYICHVMCADHFLIVFLRLYILTSSGRHNTVT